MNERACSSRFAWRRNLGGVAFSVCVLQMLGCSTLAPPTHEEISVQSEASIIVDIDGTLTKDVIKIFSVRRDAAEALRIFEQKGYAIIYLTARLPGLQLSIPNFLEKNGFPKGLVFAPQSMEENQNPAIFKTKILQYLTKRGFVLEFGYGDSSTDFEAFANSTITQDSVFALKREGALKCEPGAWSKCLDGWSEHIPFLQSIPTASDNSIKLHE